MTGTDLSVIRPALRRSSPELVLCASELDFPRPHRLNQHYIGPSVALERPPQPFPFDRVPAGCPLIYCSLGTQAYRYKRGRALLKRVVSAAARMSHLYFVVVADPSFGQYLKVIPQNVLAVSTAPQLPLLRRASVAITHGGLGTIKECILCGVPILVVPQAFDQKGNAARVEYHGLGRHAGSLPSVRRIHALLRELLLGRSYRSNMQSMRRVFERQQAASSGVSWVLHYLALARSHRAVE